MKTRREFLTATAGAVIGGVTGTAAANTVQPLGEQYSEVGVDGRRYSNSHITEKRMRAEREDVPDTLKHVDRLIIRACQKVVEDCKWSVYRDINSRIEDGVLIYNENAPLVFTARLNQTVYDGFYAVRKEAAFNEMPELKIKIDKLVDFSFNPAVIVFDTLDETALVRAQEFFALYGTSTKKYLPTDEYPDGAEITYENATVMLAKRTSQDGETHCLTFPRRQQTIMRLYRAGVEGTRDDLAKIADMLEKWHDGVGVFRVEMISLEIVNKLGIV